MNNLNKRNVKGQDVTDPSLIANNQYNEASGAQKQVDVGPKLVPLKNGNAFTTDASTARALPSMGRNVAIYNPTGTAGVATFGVAGVTLLAAGAVTADGKVGIPLKANDWTYLAASEDTHIITTAGMFTFLIEDSTALIKQSTR